METRVRFAPSPTGFLHVGNVRIAIMNYLFTRKNHGKFILRIDDTDTERSTKEYEDTIFENLAWLGIKYDELYKQSKNLSQYNEAFEYLKKIGRIYPCYESKEELSLKRKTQIMQGIPPVYDRSSLKLTDNEKKSLEGKGMKPYWRFKLSDTSASWNDLIHGPISIPLNTVSDPVITKPDGAFTYTFASVVDDLNINITHIIRGDDHVTNTASQIDIFRALNPNRKIEFAHIPLMSSIDGQEISKRIGSPLSVINMQKDGIRAQAIWNVLATLGTSQNANHSDTIDTLIEKFDFRNVSLSSPKFNLNDLKLISRKILAESKFDDVKNELAEFGNISEEFWNAIKGNIDSINETKIWYDVLINSDIKDNTINRNFAKQMLSVLKSPFDYDEWISELKKISGKKGRDLFHPIRIALTGLDSGPELKKIAHLIGYDEIKNRIEKSLD